MNYAIILAAGPVDNYSDSERIFGVPKALLPLNGETVVERLGRQLEERGITPVIAIGQEGQQGWTEKHMLGFLTLPYEVVISPYTKDRFPVKTANFMLEELQERDYDRVYIIPGDFVFSDRKMDELVSFPAPCVYGFKGNDDKSFILTKDSVRGFLDMCKDCVRWGHIILGLNWQRYTSGEGGHEPGEYDGFVEIDFAFEWEDAKKMIREEA